MDELSKAFESTLLTRFVSVLNHLIEFPACQFEPNFLLHVEETTRRCIKHLAHCLHLPFSVFSCYNSDMNSC